MSPPDRLAWIDEELRGLAAADLDRHLRTHAGPQGAELRIADCKFINFGSNDYLALAADPRLAAAAATAAEREGWGSGASPLVVGHAASHACLEQLLAEFEETEAALLFTTGYGANVGTITALVGRGDVVFSDALNHASIVDGCRLSKAEVRVYPHGDAAALEAMCADAAKFRRRLIVTDGLFSMDGDFAPLGALAEIADRYDCMLAVDEAHATGVFGAAGRGSCEAFGIEDRVDVRIGTLSKALGSIGGFVVGRRSLIEWLVNRARPYVFSTALPSAAAAASAAAVEIVCKEPERRRELLERAEGLRRALAAAGWDIGPSASQIVPLMTGSAERTLHLAAALREAGFLVPPIRPPSVPAGASRLRLSLSFGHTPAMIDELLAALRRVR
ncbi:MAG: 8-amino-7-oxononanoate synthase [Planctomycetia bacterium]|nr:8-amino-7-oxononanoate synthase [Planctomycetia bacterium]